MHQRESKKFNKDYDQIIKDTIKKPTLKLEKSISNETSGSQLEQQIISRGNIAAELNINQSMQQQRQKISKNDSLGSPRNGANYENGQNTHLGRMTQAEQLRLIEKLNKICEEQYQTSEPQSGSDEHEGNSAIALNNEQEDPALS